MSLTPAAPLSAGAACNDASAQLNVAYMTIMGESSPGGVANRLNTAINGLSTDAAAERDPRAQSAIRTALSDFRSALTTSQAGTALASTDADKFDTDAQAVADACIAIGIDGDARCMSAVLRLGDVKLAISEEIQNTAAFGSLLGASYDELSMDASTEADSTAKAAMSTTLTDIYAALTTLTSEGSLPEAQTQQLANDIAQVSASCGT